jgi:hypothetical protein
MNKSYKIQSVIFNKNYNNIEECINFLTMNNFKVAKMDKTKNYYRFRQINPKILKKQGFNIYHNKLIDPHKMIYFVLAYKDTYDYNKPSY